jgi:hypothetical protein
MADVISVNVQTGEKITRSYTQKEKDNIAAMQPTTEEKWVRIRMKRDALLHETDWASLADSPAISDAMTAYRKALRDLPASESNPDDIVFPSKP